MNANIPTIKLANGVEMPLVGYGVFLVPPPEAEQCVADALRAGYRMIDTAQAYQNEEGVGAAVAKSGLRREDVFLVTKVWISNAGEAKAAASIDESLRKLRTDYVDLLLIHQAYGDVFGTWRAMEAALRAGKVRAIGVSNFQQARYFDFHHYVETKPMVNQLQCNALVQQRGIEPLLAETDCREPRGGRRGAPERRQQGPGRGPLRAAAGGGRVRDARLRRALPGRERRRATPHRQARQPDGRHLYERLGFSQLGTIPRGFRMKDGTFANICPYYRETNVESKQ